MLANMSGSTKRKFSQVTASVNDEEYRDFQIGYARYLAEPKPSSSVDTATDRHENSMFHSSDARPTTRRYDHDGSTKNVLSLRILETLDTNLHQTMEIASEPASIARGPINKRNRMMTRPTEVPFSLLSLQKAYEGELTETFDNNHSTDYAASVRQMADAVKCNLQVKGPDQVETGTELLVQFLGHCLKEFICRTKIAVLEEALTHARHEMHFVYEDKAECRCQLRMECSR